MHLSIHSQSPGFKVKMLDVPNAADKDHSRLSMLLFGNPNAGNQYPISSYKVDEDGIWIEYSETCRSGMIKVSNAEKEFCLNISESDEESDSE